MSKYHNEDSERLAEIFQALANPNRIRIFMSLLSCCKPGTECDAKTGALSCIGDLGKDLEIVPSTVSHHIKELSRAGLIKTKREGKVVRCWVDLKILDELAEFFLNK